jgi:hypothetical protein
MKRLSVPRASTAVAVIAAIVVVLAVMVGVAQGLISGQAGPPTQVFMQTTEGDVEEVCLDPVTRENQSAMHQDLHLEAGSSVVALFSFGLTHLDVHERGIVGIILSGGGEPGHRFASEIWGFPGNANFSNSSGTVTWSFPDVPTTGDYTVDVRAFLGFPEEPSHEVRQATMEGCSLTVFVSPAKGVSTPIGAGHVELNENFAFAGGFEVGAFVPTGSNSDKCLVTLSESNFATSGQTVYCGVRQVGGQFGIFVHVFLPVPAPEHFVMSLTVYQEFATGYGQPVPSRD